MFLTDTKEYVKSLMLWFHSNFTEILRDDIIILPYGQKTKQLKWILGHTAGK